MTWNPITGSFTPGRPGAVQLPGANTGQAGSAYITVADLVNMGLIDPGAMGTGGRLAGPGVLTMTSAVSTALASSAASIEMNSGTLFKKMNGAAGVVIGSGGIAGYDSSGTATFTIDPATGDVTLSGTITATAGTIGGFTLGATTLTAGSGATAVGLASSGTYLIYAGHTTPASAPFSVATNGDVIAGKITGGTFTGNVTGDVSGSSGSCTGNAATATTAANASLLLNASWSSPAVIGDVAPVAGTFTALTPDTTASRSIGTTSLYWLAVYNTYNYSSGLLLSNNASGDQTTSTRGMLSQHVSHDLAAARYKGGSVPGATTAPYMYFNVGGYVVGSIDAVGIYIVH